MSWSLLMEHKGRTEKDDVGRTTQTTQEGASRQQAEADGYPGVHLCARCNQPGSTNTCLHQGSWHTQLSQRGGTLENSGEMIGWELRELRLRVTKNDKISKSSQMRNKINPEKKPEQGLGLENMIFDGSFTS